MGGPPTISSIGNHGDSIRGTWSENVQNISLTFSVQQLDPWKGVQCSAVRY